MFVELPVNICYRLAANVRYRPTADPSVVGFFRRRHNVLPEYYSIHQFIDTQISWSDYRRILSGVLIALSVRT